MPANAKAVVAIAILVGALSACATDRTEPSAKMVVERRFDAFKRRDVDAIAELYAADAQEASPGFCQIRRGPDGARKTYAELFQAFPTISDDVTLMMVDGDRVAVQFVASVRKTDGTPLFDAPLAEFLTVEHGRITRDDTYFDPKGQACR